MKLGLSLTAQQLNQGEILPPNVPVLQIGEDLGPGAGVIYYETPTTGDEITYKEYSQSQSLINHDIIKFFKFINPSASVTWENVLNSFNYINAGNNIVYNAEYFASNENEDYTYLDNDNQYELLSLDTNSDPAILENWKNYFLDILPNDTRFSNYEHCDYIYKFTNLADNTVSIKRIRINVQTLNIVTTNEGYDLTAILPFDTYILASNAIALNTVAVIPIISRDFTIATDPLVQRMSTMPSSPNVFPTENITTLTPQFISNYNGITAQTLPSFVDRYRTISEVKSLDLENTSNPLYNEFRINAFNSAENTRIVSFSTRNRQIVVKVVNLSTSKPPAPWFDRNAGEKLTLECQIKCHGNKRTTSGVLSGLASLQTINVQETNLNSQITGGSANYQGQTLYYSERRFLIDVSNIIFSIATVLETGQIIIETFNVLEKSYDGTQQSGYRSLIFELLNIKIKSNQRYGQTQKILYSQTGLIAVPTYKGENFPVGYDMSFTLNNTTEDSFNNSLETGVKKMDSSLDYSYAFNQYKLDIDFLDYTTGDFYYTWNVYPFEFRTGALNSNYELVNLSGEDLLFTVTIDLRYENNYRDTIFKLRRVITVNEVETATELISQECEFGVFTDIEAVDEFNALSPLVNGASLRYEIQLQNSTSTVALADVFYLIGSISGREGVAPFTSPLPFVTTNTKFRPKFNYF